MHVRAASSSSPPTRHALVLVVYGGVAFAAALLYVPGARLESHGEAVLFRGGRQRTALGIAWIAIGKLARYVACVAAAFVFGAPVALALQRARCTFDDLEDAWRSTTTRRALPARAHRQAVQQDLVGAALLVGAASLLIRVLPAPGLTRALRDNLLDLPARSLCAALYAAAFTGAVLLLTIVFIGAAVLAYVVVAVLLLGGRQCRTAPPGADRACGRVVGAPV
ncbi:Uncharacterized protein PBTT_06317 [Plasmodiophora brassicae]